MFKVKLGLRKKADGTFEFFAIGVDNAMTTNAATFPGSAATVTLLGTKLTTFSADLQEYLDKKTALEALRAAKDNSRAEVEVVLRSLAGQVDTVAQGDVEIIALAGMQSTNEPAPVYMTQVFNLRLTPSTFDGAINAEWDKVFGRLIYDVQICLDVNMPLTNWVNKLQTSKTNCTLNDTLVSGQKVWVRVRAIGANGPGPWSDPACKTVP